LKVCSSVSEVHLHFSRVYPPFVATFSTFAEVYPRSYKVYPSVKLSTVIWVSIQVSSVGCHRRSRTYTTQI